MSLVVSPRAHSADTLELAFVAVRTDHLLLTRDERGRAVDEVLFDNFPYLGRAACQALGACGLAREDYTILPVHRWQLEVTVPEAYPDELRTRVVAPLDGVRLPVVSTASPRTVLTPPGRTGGRLLVRVAFDPNPARFPRGSVVTPVVPMAPVAPAPAASPDGLGPERPSSAVPVEGLAEARLSLPDAVRRPGRGGYALAVLICEDVSPRAAAGW